MSYILRIVGLAFRRYNLSLALAYLTLFGSATSALAVPKLIGSSINRVLESAERDTAQLYLLGFGLLLVGLARGLFAFGQGYLGERISQKLAYDIRNAFYDRLQRLSFAFHDRQQTGNLMSRATADIEGVRMFMNMGLVRSGFILVMVLGIAILMLLTHWRLALLSLFFVPLIAAASIFLSRRLRQSWMQVQALTGELVTVLQESLSGMRVVKAFAAEEHEQERFSREATQVAAQERAAERLGAASVSIMNFVFTAATGLILWFGGQDVINGRQVVEGTVLYQQLTPGQLTEFILYMGLLAMPVRMIGWLVNTFARAASCGERLFEILDAESPVQERPGALPLRRIRGHVSFENVSFSYDHSVPVLSHIDLEVQPGQTIALLGHPGSGKSTLVHLLPRFYDVTAGRVLLDGVDVRDTTLLSLREKIGIVQQDIFIFLASLRDNIAYGKPEATLEEVVQAAKTAQLHDFIMTLPEGYDTWVGERGVTLSGGQRQRLAIARTLLLNPPVLILDDSTSSVDAQTEQQIQRALAEVVKERTTFMITHRLSAIRQASLILVLNHGAIIERGTHEELLALGGEYRSIYDLQLKPAEEGVLAQALPVLPGREEGRATQSQGARGG